MEQTHDTQLAQVYDVLVFRRVIARYDVVSWVYETGPCCLVLGVSRGVSAV